MPRISKQHFQSLDNIFFLILYLEIILNLKKLPE